MTMREEELFTLVNRQDAIIKKRIRENYRKVLEEEFVMNSIFLRYLEYLDKSNTQEHIDINELAKKSEAPTKRIREFDISGHDTASSMYLHKHTYIEIDYVYRGGCNYYINNEENVFQLREKELCIINQNVVHGIEAPDEQDMVFKLMIPFDYIEPEKFREIGQDSLMKKFLTHALDENLTRASYMVFDIKDRDAVEEIMYRLFYEYVTQETGWKQAVRDYLSVLFILLMRIKEDGIRMVKELEEENLNITKVLNCIRKNYQYITLKDIADDLHFHENYLSRMIKQNSKQGFRGLLCRFRLEEAENLLLNTDLSVTEIAARVGYHKPNFFYKLFKGHYGVTPVEFRRSGIKNSNT
jgi:YesN/AraC family two-component response regulator